MKGLRFKKFGPFSYFRIKDGRKNFISAWLTGFDDKSFGWEWGSDDNGSDPAFCVRLWHLNLLSYESFKNNGHIVYLLGFWWMN